MARDAQREFHEKWLGLAQPYEGLVFAVPVLAEAQIAPQVSADLTARFKSALSFMEGEDEGHFGDLPSFFENFLGYLRAGSLVPRDSLAPDVHFYSQEGGQDVRPSFAIARSLPESPEDDLFAGFGEAPKSERGADEQGPPSSKRASSDYAALVWDLRDDAGEAALGLDLDKPEQQTGAWRYPPTAKMERLLRATGISVGLLSNGRDIRLIYAPSGESTSHLTFRGADMQTAEGRPILAAFELLLSASRTYEAAPEYTLEGLLKASRSRQADVTKELASQVFEAVELLLGGFEAASHRDASAGGADSLRAALEAPNDHAYQGVLSVVLRLVFLLYAEDSRLLPVESELYARYLSVKGLYDELVEDAGQHPESMNHRFGAYGRLLALFRAVFLGVEHGDLKLPPRRGRLFDPNTYPFLEGGLPGTTVAIRSAEERAQTRPPSIDDGTIYEVLHRLIFFQGQRLSYASLDVEQLGSVYESLMGYHVLRVAEPAVRLGKNRLWVELGELRRQKGIDRTKLLKEGAGLSAAQIAKVDALLKEHSEDGALLDALNDLSPGNKKERHRHVAAPGRLVLQPGEERRRSGSHYTPRSLTEGIVRKTLEPLLRCLGEERTAEQILSLKICDPAMGSGAFLVEVVRQLADEIETAWTREGRIAEITAEHHDPKLHAKRLVAQRCIYGVDKNPAAVELAKLSLWLVTLSADLPFTFIDHSLRHGDSLVGLTLDQIRSFSWKEEKQIELFGKELNDALDQALEHRKGLVELADSDTPATQEERRRLLDHADSALKRARWIADACVGAFFSEEKDKARNTERLRRRDLIDAWLRGNRDLEPEVEELAREAREKLSPFHWMLEFPEVFYQERPDPLDGGRVNGAAMMDAFVGNPPFLGGRRVSGEFGNSYSEWLEMVHESSKNADLSAQFFRRAANLLGSHGTIGLIATNTIGQGDTRESGLGRLVQQGLRIFSATRDMPWPGDAAVTVSVVHLAKGRTSGTDSVLDGLGVPQINSRLDAMAERSNPQTLSSNRSCSFQGTVVVGTGFLLAPEMRELLVAKDARNTERIRPYLGGEEVNSSPTQSFERFAINFGDLPLEAAEEWPDLIAIVRDKVKPERGRVNREAHRKYWWQYGDKRPALYAAIAPLSRCLVTAIVSKHLIFSFQPTNRIFSHKLYVFPFDHFTPFSVLQSRIHNCWAWFLSSTMRNAGINYSASDCFETFPFPVPDPRTVIPELETLGEKLYEPRAKYMVDTDQGLTKTYNALKDPSVTDPRILELRALHEELDRTVLRAYGWSDLPVPPFCIASAADGAALSAFEDEVIDRLFVLNEQRAQEEAKHLATSGTSKPKKGTKSGPSKSAAAKKSSKKSPGGESGQGSLF